MTEIRDKETQEIINYFMELAKIPRKSGHEEEVSTYLYKWALENHFDAERDLVNNVIIDRSAGKGCEDKPLAILQAHMDMVCVAEEGYAYNPLTDSIKVLDNGKTLTADRTSLGADDGIGVAIAQYILTSDIVCGPLRVIFTVNEEELMLGAKSIEEKHLDAVYLINLDSEVDSVLTNSSAGGMSILLDRTVKTDNPQRDTPISLSIGGLVGGHSGVEINTGRLNAIRAVCYTLLALDQAGVAYELGSIKGGSADNAIPNVCTAELMVNSSQMEIFNQVFQRVKKLLQDTYRHTEQSMEFTCTPIERLEQVLSSEDKNAIITCTTQIINGVHTMSPMVEGLVQSSSNLGIISADENGIHISVYWRSSDELFIEQMKAQNIALAQMFGFRFTEKSSAPGWPVNPKSHLVSLVTQIYREQTGDEMSVEAIHAGLECSWFYAKNPKLDLISVGPNLTGVHSPAETLQTASIPKVLKLVSKTLQSL